MPRPRFAPAVLLTLLLLFDGQAWVAAITAVITPARRVTAWRPPGTWTALSTAWPWARVPSPGKTRPCGWKRRGMEMLGQAVRSASGMMLLHIGGA
ncbi:hypothetical protein [Nitrospirillum sp. BR 11163]|uniref:hypothetical protein n=1 Tax=Nitrospirillum sp. BR 11163 TaxID=3104323 RepID=UPI002AFF3DB3|nr:hypothetical protein [Nitrospirillum sp. BR 11163]MEA1675239.1 hypothetical protein [Nitrospirillum sp. BR 11163]